MYRCSWQKCADMKVTKNRDYPRFEGGAFDWAVVHETFIRRYVSAADEQYWATLARIVIQAEDFSSTATLQIS